jgi:DoxX-like family
MYRTFINYFIAAVWIINGLWCKLANMVPRHEQIVGRILGEEYAPLLTKTIGILEIFMAVWIITKISSRLCAIVQILIVLAMNIMEFFLVPDLLLFGKLNGLFACLFAFLIYLNEFVIYKKNSGRI